MNKIVDCPFRKKEYKNHNEYIEHQKSKLANGITWLDSYEKLYERFLKKLLQKEKFRQKSCLCLGSRRGTEVRVFNELGIFAIGIDLNPGEDNRYVVTGDASNIQYPDNSVDMVYTNSFDHFLEIDKVLEEIKRVLKPDGLLIFLAASPHAVKGDRYGAVYWDNLKDVLSYFDSKYGFKLIKRTSVNNIGWFSDFIVMRLR